MKNMKKNKINLNDEHISVMKNIVEFNEFKYVYLKEHFDSDDKIFLSIISILSFLCLLWKEYLGGFFILPMFLSFLFFIGCIYENKINKKLNIYSEKEYKNTLELIFDNIDKNYLTILSLKELIDDLETHKLIYKTYIDKENFEYKSDITIKQFKDLLKNKIYKNEKKKEKFLNQI